MGNYVFKFVGTKWARVSFSQIKRGDYYEIYSAAGEYLQCGLSDDFCYSKSKGKWSFIDYSNGGTVEDVEGPGRIRDDLKEYAFDYYTQIIVSEDEYEFLKRIVT